MTWYKLELKGGRGHTNQEIEYVWSDYLWDKDEVESQWDSWADQFGYERMWDGHVTFVKHLPSAERKKKVAKYKEAIKQANEMLKVLEAHNDQDRAGTDKGGK